LFWELRRLHPLHGVGLKVALSHHPLEEGVQAAVAVVGGGRLPAGQLVGDEGLDVLTAELAGEQRLAVSLTVAGEEPDGVGVGLDGPGALVLGFQGPPKAPVQDQEMAPWQMPVAGYGVSRRHRSLIRVWWSGWLTAACSG
jgi:hypothetical protein